jgi:hypothetical protein
MLHFQTNQILQWTFKSVFSSTGIFFQVVRTDLFKSLLDVECDCRTWHPGRIVLTSDIIAFVRPNEETLLDVIPLTDVIGVEMMQEVNHKGSPEFQRSLSEITVENVIDFANAFQIRTRKNGHNAGRKYFVQAGSKDTLRSLVMGIPNFGKAAVLRANEQPFWRRLQQQVCAMYSASWFQGLASFLIMVVSTKSIFSGSLLSKYSASLMTLSKYSASLMTCLLRFTEFRNHHRRGAAAARTALRLRRIPYPSEADARQYQPGIHRHLHGRALHKPL